MQTSVKRNFNRISYYFSYIFLTLKWLHDLDFMVWYWHVYFSKGTHKGDIYSEF